MYDFIKIWIENKDQIQTVLDNPLLDFTQNILIDTGEIINYPIFCKWNVFTFKLMSATRLQMIGSLHKYWNVSNENDFDFKNITITINKFCKTFKIDPNLCTIHNLETGVNIKPVIKAEILIDNILCYKNSLFNQRTDIEFLFTEFKQDGYYFKIYDKGTQYKTVNTLRIEVKYVRSKFLNKAGIVTLSDLLKPEPMQVLGEELAHFSKFIVFNDPTILRNNLNINDLDIYDHYKYSENWKKGIQRKITKQKRKENRFKEIVDEYGNWNIYTTIKNLILDKVWELTNSNNWSNSISKCTMEVAHSRLCRSCNKPLHPDQKKGSFYCSAKYVSYEAAHKCRNTKSNPRNNKIKKINKINKRGVLFDITPFIIAGKPKTVTG